jgi:ribonuclease D
VHRRDWPQAPAGACAAALCSLREPQRGYQGPALSASVADLAAAAAGHGRLAIDTEFVSERRYRAQLCLVQVAVPQPGAPDDVLTEVIDPLEGAGPDQVRPLADALANPDIEVVMHAGRQDIALLRRAWRTEIRGVFDTQVAGGFVGLGSQEGYESLVRKVLGVQLRGSEGFTRWDRRPLSEQQLAYAADDARLLLALGSGLEERLAEAGRLDWAREESHALESSSDEREPDRLYERLPRIGRLSPKQRAVARELVEWRERTAEAMDRPGGFVLSDATLVELARRSPRDLEALESIRGLPPQTYRRRGEELLRVLQKGAEREPPPAPPEPPRRDPHDAPLVSLAQSLVRQRSLESGVAFDVIANQSELAALVTALRRGEEPRDVRVASGWRAELVGRELHELIAGRLTLSVGADGRLQVSES